MFKAITTSLVYAFSLMVIFQTATVHAAGDKNLEKPMPASKHLDSIVLGAGCFWGAEKRYQAIPGVIDAVSGYADGKGIKPTYKEITRWRYRSDPNNYAEVVKVTYNTAQVDLEMIIRKYFETHDPTQLNRQGNDVGTQYRSTILTNSSTQADIAQKIKKAYQKRLSAKGYGKIVTKIKPLSKFFPAEAYHQDYLAKNPNGYCPDHSTGVTFDGGPKRPAVNNTALLKGQQIVVIESEGCAFCEKFKIDVVSKYTKETPITFRKANELKRLQLKTPTWATPTILFLNNGKEVFGHQGYMSPRQFYTEHKGLKFQ